MHDQHHLIAVANDHLPVDYLHFWFSCGLT